MKVLSTYRGQNKEVTAVTWHPEHEELFVSGGQVCSPGPGTKGDRPKHALPGPGYTFPLPRYTLRYTLRGPVWSVS
eukprot:8294678-Pyramimonas_sp.AAC.2